MSSMLLRDKVVVNGAEVVPYRGRSGLCAAMPVLTPVAESAIVGAEICAPLIVIPPGSTGAPYGWLLLRRESSTRAATQAPIFSTLRTFRRRSVNDCDALRAVYARCIAENGTPQVVFFSLLLLVASVFVATRISSPGSIMDCDGVVSTRGGSGYGVWLGNAD